MHAFKKLIATFILASAGVPAAMAQDVQPKSDEQIMQEKSTRVFLDSRMSSILFSQTDRLSRTFDMSDNIETTQGATAANLEGFSGPGWVSLNGRRSSLDGSDLDIGVITVGGDIFIDPNGIFGVMFQNDVAAQDGANGATFDATGYMAGVYGIRQLGGVTIDARLLAGETRNDITNFGERTDNVKSQRWSAAVQVLRAEELGNGGILVPNGGISWFEDKIDAYNLGVTPVDAETIQYGQANLGTRLYLPITMGGTQGDIVLGASGVFGFGESAGADVPDELRGRLDVGFELYNTDVWQASVGMFIDGVGQDAYEATGLDLGVVLWF